jgi:hypothetical protein
MKVICINQVFDLVIGKIYEAKLWNNEYLIIDGKEGKFYST